MNLGVCSRGFGIEVSVKNLKIEENGIGKEILKLLLTLFRKENPRNSLNFAQILKFSKTSTQKPSYSESRNRRLNELNQYLLMNARKAHKNGTTIA